MPYFFKGRTTKTVAQGLAAGKPVVAFDVDGSKEIIINEKTGYLVPAKNVKELVSTILYALSNKDKSISMAREGQKLIKKLFPVEVMVDSIEKVYNESQRIVVIPIRFKI